MKKDFIQDSLLHYIEQNLTDNVIEEKKIPGPVVTISREYGCPGYPIARSLAERLSTMADSAGHEHEWRCMDRDILIEAAKEIRISPATIEQIIRSKGPGFSESLYQAFSDHNAPENLDVKRIVAGIVRSLATVGYNIIVGRAGAIIARDIEKSAHVHIFAPLDWRIPRVMSKDNLELEDAKKRIHHVDNERVYLRNFFSGEPQGMDPFDLVLNAAHLNEEQILDQIIVLLKSKGVLGK